MNFNKYLKIRFIGTILVASALIIITSISSSSTVTIIPNSYGQMGSMATLQNTPGTYAVSIVPGAAQRDSPYHYYPPAINVPVGTTVVWFNNDFGQPHTVTSGVPNSSHTGDVFNSGIMPATANAFFQYTFDKSGNYVYHCIIHPWRQAIVSVSDSFEKGQNLQMSSGVGSVFNLTKDYRALLDFKPLTVTLDRTTPIVFNITLLENNNNTLFTETFVTSGESLPLELIKNNGNETNVYGPDFSSTGAYHIDVPFLDGNKNYTIRAEVTSINSVPPQNPIVEEFVLHTVV
ncbi:cupredoxin domain-containing protein [Candidatus Nitrosocosmicus sp. R]